MRTPPTPLPRGTRGLAGLVGAVALVALVAGCGGSADPLADVSSSVQVGPSGAASAGVDATGPAGADPRGVVATYRDWLAALASRDAAEACRIQAPELTIELRYRAIAEDRAELGDPCVDFEALLWEDPTRELEPIGIETTQVSGEKATLAVDFATTDLTVALVVERAGWRVLDETPRADPSVRATAEPDRWLAAWCDLATGQPRAEVVAAMGQPSGVYTVTDGGEPQLWWALRQYDFRAYLDGDGPDARVLDLVGDYDALSSADRDRLGCPELR